MKLKISCSVILTNIVITLSNVAQQSSSITNRELHQIYIYIKIGILDVKNYTDISSQIQYI